MNSYMLWAYSMESTSKTALGDLFDVVLGRNDISRLGIKLNFTDQPVEWMEYSIPMRSSAKYLPEQMQEAIDSELFAAEPIKILERNYQSVTASEITAA